LSHDPKGYIDGMNLYQAFAGNPVNYTDPWGEQQVGGGRVLDQPMRDVGGGGAGGAGGANFIQSFLEWMGSVGDKITRMLRGGQPLTPVSPLAEVIRKVGSGGPALGIGPEFPPQMFLPDPCAPPQVSRESFPPPELSNSGSVTHGLPETPQVSPTTPNEAAAIEAMKQRIRANNKELQEEDNTKGIRVALGMWTNGQGKENIYFWKELVEKRLLFHLGHPGVPGSNCVRDALALGPIVFWGTPDNLELVAPFTLWRTYIFLKLANVKTIYFDITYLEKSSKIFDFGATPGYFARKEMEMILNDKELFKKARFYEQGKYIPKAQIRSYLQNLGFFN